MRVRIHRPEGMSAWVAFRRVTGHSVASSRAFTWPIEVNLGAEDMPEIEALRAGGVLVEVGDAPTRGEG